MLNAPEGGTGPLAYLAAALGSNVGQGGKFDYQREANSDGSFTHLNQFVHVSNFNVGLFCQQAGLSFDETVEIAGTYATFRSKNKNKQPYVPNSDNYEFMKKGYEAGKSGMFANSNGK